MPKKFGSKNQKILAKQYFCLKKILVPKVWSEKILVWNFIGFEKCLGAKKFWVWKKLGNFFLGAAFFWGGFDFYPITPENLVQKYFQWKNTLGAKKWFKKFLFLFCFLIPPRGHPISPKIQYILQNISFTTLGSILW